MDNIPTRSLRQICRAIWTQYDISILACVLLTLSAYFYWGARQRQTITETVRPDLFNSGDLVDVVMAVDGDEVIIGTAEGETTKFRILGIKSFNPTLRDPLILEYGKICFDYLKRVAVGKKARLVVSDKRVDNEGRLLGTLFLEGTDGKYDSNLATDLIRKGYTLVYTRFDFPDIDAYLDVQRQARETGEGFWMNDRITARADSLLLLWNQEKNRDH